ncbi:MAG: hypothetical protein AAF670_04405 [Planctomycetota bacterium]
MPLPATPGAGPEIGDNIARSSRRNVESPGATLRLWRGSQILRRSHSRFRVPLFPTPLSGTRLGIGFSTFLGTTSLGLDPLNVQVHPKSPPAFVAQRTSEIGNTAPDAADRRLGIGDGGRTITNTVALRSTGSRPMGLDRRVADASRD